MILMSEKMMSQTITDEFIFLHFCSRQQKKHMNNVKLK
jgi:hypothetical protein